MLFAYNESSSIEKLNDAIKKSNLNIDVKTSYQVPTLSELTEDCDLEDSHKIIILEGIRTFIHLKGEQNFIILLNYTFMYRFTA